ncbi:hypothetical protein V5799_021841 [Amblyomma americanum]|uniref:Nlr family card domain protein n=1 Tax=Amblyomma americanum TaxID=6943 RepID=A0AAQ4FNS3_AMBAM
MLLKLVRQRSARRTAASPASPPENAGASAAGNDMDVDVEEQSGLPIARPCTAGNDGSEEVCHVFQELSSWNRCLWYVGLQLRELTAPGELSLVQVRDQGCGHEQEERSRQGRLLFRLLITLHHCVVSLDLCQAIIEDCSFGEFHYFVAEPIQRNSTLRKLTLGGFRGYDFIRPALFAAIATKTDLQEFDFVDSGVFLDMINPLRVLLENATANISKLSIPGLHFDAEHANRLVASLGRNGTIQELSVHVSILSSLFPSGTARFLVYVGNCERLQALTVTDDRDVIATVEVRSIVEALLLPRSNILRLKLLGFLLDEDCAYQFSRLLARNGPLESLDIIECRWMRAAPLSPYSIITQEVEHGLGLVGPHISGHVRTWAEAFIQNTTLRFLALDLFLLTAVDFGIFFEALSSVRSLRTVLLGGVAVKDLPQLGQIIRDTGMCQRVSVDAEYLVYPALLYALEDCPQVLRHASVNSSREPSPAVCRETLLNLTTARWCQLTTLRLCLSQEFFDDSLAGAMDQCLNEATSLKELELGGCEEPDLSRLTGEGSLNPVLRALFSSPSMRTLKVCRFRFGLANLRFLAEAVLTNRTLCEFLFSSCDPVENTKLLQFIAQDFAENDTMIDLRVSKCGEVETQVERAVIQGVLGRNLGFVTCAAHFVVYEERSGRCEESLGRVHQSSALTSKVQELATAEEGEATEMIRSMFPTT